jgi:hypothetical protein
MIDLSQFVGKNIRVTFRNKRTKEGLLSLNGIYLYPYKVRWDDDTSTFFDTVGNSDCLFSSHNIIKIEEIKPMNKYEELEKQVAEMQKEIDRLKREEKNYPKLKPVEIIRTVRFTPEEYFEWCEQDGEEPTEEGYVEYYSEPEVLDDCFVNRSSYTQEIKVVEN